MTAAAPQQDEKSQLLAKMKTGIDISKERAKRARWAAISALVIGAGIGLYRYRGQLKAVVTSDLTAQDLAGQSFSTGEIRRIMAVEPWVEKYAADQNLSPDFVNGVIWVESRFQPEVVSSVGARGLMQLMPRTQSWWEETGGIPKGDPFNPKHNIQVGTYGLRRLMGNFPGDKRKVLGAYNWGLGNVQKHPNSFPESVENYVTWVLAAERRFDRARRS